jgi:hypothetical protein
MLDSSYPHPFLGEAPGLVVGKYEEDVSRILVNNKIDRATFFFEFYGTNSFAGYHFEEEHTVTMIDVSVYKKGYLPPKEYLSLFDEIDIAPLLYHGNINEDFASQVRDGTLPGMTFEGVVCKGKHPKKGNSPYMFKVKSQAWYDKLRERCEGDEKLFKELA